MAIVWVDGFEGYTTSTDLTGRGYSLNGTNYSFAQSPRISGNGSSIYMVAGREIAITDNTLATPTVIVGFAYKIDDQNTQNAGASRLIYFYNGTSIQTTIDVTASGQLRATRGGTVQLGSDSTLTVPANGTWFWIEAKVFVDSSAGTVLVKVNGVTYLNLTGQNTRTVAGSANVTRVIIGSQQYGGFFDDFYVADTSGSFNNDFLGSIKVCTSNPIANGSTNQWTAVGDTTNYKCVDETAVGNNNTDYVEDSTAGHVDLYDVTNVPTGLSGKAVWVECSAEKTTSGTQQIRVQAHSSASDATSGIFNPTQSVYSYFGFAFDQDPNGSITWTGTNINAAEFGVKLEA